MLVFSRKTRVLRVAIIAALAGGATLAGESLGARLLRPLAGGTAPSHAGSVAGVLGGLGLGAWLSSRWQKQRAPDALAEKILFALAALSLLAPTASSLLAVPCARVLVSASEAFSFAGTFLGALLAALCSLPFGLLSGALYPCLAALHGGSAGSATAVTGAASSLAAALISLVVSFALAPDAGVQKALYAIAVLYLFAAVLTRSFALEKDETKATTHTLDAPDAPLDRSILASLALVGITSTAWQLTLARLGALSFGPSAYSFAAALAAHTTALGIGEALASRRVERSEEPKQTLANLFLLACAGVLLGAHALPSLPSWSAERFADAANQGQLTHNPGRVWAAGLAALAVLSLPVSGALGAALPYAARALASSNARANAGVLSAMAIGNVLGALLIPLLLLPRLGAVGTLLSVSLLAAIAALSLFATERLRSLTAIAVGAVLFLTAYTAPARWIASELSRGPFLYGRGEQTELGTIVRFLWGREAAITLRRDDAGAVLLQIDGKVDATNTGDAVPQTLVGLFPVLLHPRPERVLLVGLGSGMTADAVRAVPSVQHITALELLPEVRDAAAQEFRQANHRVLDDAKVRVVLRDAALHLRGTRATYDVIVHHPSHPWVSGMADLFTEELFRSAHDRLNPGGIFACWFHAYGTDGGTVASLAATFRSVFTQTAIAELTPAQDYLLVGVRTPAQLDMDRTFERLQHPRIAEALSAAGITDRGAFLGRFIAGSDGVAAIARNSEVFSASDLRLEFRAPWLLYRDATQEVLSLLSRAQDLPLAGLNARGTQLAAAIEESEPSREAGLHARQASQRFAAGQLNEAIAEGELAVAAAPRDRRNRDALARYYLRRAGFRRMTDAAGAGEDWRAVLGLNPSEPERFRALSGLGDLAVYQEQFAVAARNYGAALELARSVGAPTPELHLRMGQVLAALGDVPNALRELDLAEREETDSERRETIQEVREAVVRGGRVLQRIRNRFMPSSASSLRR